MKRIGVFGGTFDPVHLGHLILAELAREQGELDEVWFVPAARPPHKLDRDLTPYSQRVEMLALAIAGQPAFRVEEVEKNRPGPSYTADTLDALSQQHPDAEWFLMIGSDTLTDLPGWHEPERILRRAGLMIMLRSDHPIPDLDSWRATMKLPKDFVLHLRVIQAPLLDISSRDLRRRAAEGRSLRYQVPRAVECYIHDKKLYQHS